MSGFEIAGVVLGAIPIAIEIYDVYRVRSDSIFKYAEVMRKFVRTLHTAHSRLRNCLEKLLHGRVDDKTFSELLDNPKTDLWNDPTLEVNLRELLQQSYFGYVKTLIEIRDSLRKLEILVGLDDKNSKSWLDLIKFNQTKYRFHKTVWKRITVCIDHKKHIELLQSLDKCIDELEQLTTGSLDLEPIRKGKKTKTKAQKIESVRQFARSLHSSLRSRWLCQCQHPHWAHLQLENLSLAEGTKLRFRLLVSYGDIGPANSQSSFELKEIEIEPHEKFVPARPTTISLNIPIPTAPSTTTLDDLCSELARSHTSHCCIGFVEDADATHYIYKVHPSSYAGAATQPPVPLSDLISRRQGSNQNSKLSISDKQKYELAVTLATSVLQLNKTSWLKERWSCNDVVLLPLPGETSPARCAYISRPFAPIALPRASTIPQPERPTVRNEAIFALGVALTELSLGQSLDSFVETTDLDPNGQRTVLTDFIVARRLINQVSQNEGERYTNAVNRCIHGIFDGLHPDLANEKFRDGFYNGVVAELWDVFQDFIR